MYAYVFLSTPAEKAGSAVRIFASGGFALGSAASEVRVDDEGHCEASDWKHVLEPSDWTRLAQLLDQDVDLQLELRDEVFFFALMFARHARTPHVLLGWSDKLFDEMIPTRRARFLQLLEEFAESLSGIVILVREPPGYFEDYVEVGQDSALVEAVDTLGRPIDVWQIWTDRHLELRGAAARPIGKRSGRFSKFVLGSV